MLPGVFKVIDSIFKRTYLIFTVVVWLKLNCFLRVNWGWVSFETRIFDMVVPPWRRRGWWTETKWDAYEFKCWEGRICHVGGRGRERLEVVKSIVKRRQAPTACIFITAFIKVIVRYTPSRIIGTFRPRTMRFILGVVLLEFPSLVSECGFRSSAFRPFPQPPSTFYAQLLAKHYVS